MTAPKLIVCERDYTTVGAKMSALGPLLETLGTMTKGVAVNTAPEMELLRKLNGVISDGPAAGQPAIVTAAQACEAILTLSGTTNGRVAVEGFRAVEERTGRQLADLALDNEGKRITFADTQARPVPVITSPEWSGSEHGGRRYTAFTINVERLKPWHTLTGRQHFFLDHDWMTEIGEQLPTFRPTAEHAPAVRRPGNRGGPRGHRAVPDPALEVVHPLGVPGQPVHALAVARWAGDLDEPAGRRRDRGQGQRVDRGVQPQRCGRRARDRVAPDAHRARCTCTTPKDRTVDVPRTETSGLRGGIHNSLTRLMIKPTHFIGGYAQLSVLLNYLGPTGNQRDEVTVIRRRSQEVKY